LQPVEGKGNTIKGETIRLRHYKEPKPKELTPEEVKFLEQKRREALKIPEPQEEEETTQEELSTAKRAAAPQEKLPVKKAGKQPT